MERTHQFLSSEGLRVDGRRASEFRKLKCKLGLLKHADGSAYVEIGNTKVLATVYGPHESRQRSHTGRSGECCDVTCEYAMATFATSERRARWKGDRRSEERATVLRDAFESCIMTQLFPLSEIDIFLQILQTNGSERAAAFNAGMLALVDAGIPLTDLPAACEVGFLEGTPLLDMNYREETGGGPQILVGMITGSDKVVTLQSDRRITKHTAELARSRGLQGI